MQTGETAPGDEHVGVAAAVLGPPLALGLLVAQLAEAGRVSQHLLVQRPQPPRADERLVVEARRGERPTDDVGHAHRIELERSRVDVLHLESLADRLRARPRSGGAVDGDDAVRALTGAAHQAAAAVVLEAAREGPLTGRVQGRSDRVPLVGLDALAVERERQRLAAVDALARLLGEPAHDATSPWARASPGSAVHRTSLVTVSRSATNHARQPER